MSKIGETRKEKKDDETEIWRLVAIEKDEDMTVWENRLAKVEQDILDIEDFDEEEFARIAVIEERANRQAMKAEMERERERLKARLGL